MHFIELPRASNTLIFGKHTKTYKLSGGLMICPMTIGHDLDAWNTQLIYECMLGNGGICALTVSRNAPVLSLWRLSLGRYEIFWDQVKSLPIM